MKVVRLKRLLTETDVRAGKRSLELPLLAVSIAWGVKRRDEVTSDPHAATDLSDYKVCARGHLVINRMRAFQGALGIAPEAGLVSPDYSVLAISGEVNRRWLMYRMGSVDFVHAMAAVVRGIGGTESGVVRTPRLNVADLGRLEIQVPDSCKQAAIADFLDRETARIDTLIKEQERLIELLRERRSALVCEVFADRLANSRLQHACLDIVDCLHATPEPKDEGAFEAVRTASVRDGRYRPNHGIRVSEATWRARNAGGAPTVGDVLFTREAPAGEACMVPSEDICLGQRMVLLRIDTAQCNGRFLLWQLYADRVQDHFRLSVNGSTVGNVRLPVLRSTPVWLPGLDDQRQIVAALDGQTAKIDVLISETDRFVALARERRAALITAAVTGQIAVREPQPLEVG